jgi:hypothetical protein
MMSEWSSVTKNPGHSKKMDQTGSNFHTSVDFQAQMSNLSKVDPYRIEEEMIHAIILFLYTAT